MYLPPPLQEADEDGHGQLSLEQFKSRLGPYLLRPGQSDATLTQLFLKIDADAGGTVDWDEFINYLFLQSTTSTAATRKEWRFFGPDCSYTGWQVWSRVGSMHYMWVGTVHYNPLSYIVIHHHISSHILTCRHISYAPTQQGRGGAAGLVSHAHPTSGMCMIPHTARGGLYATWSPDGTVRYVFCMCVCCCCVEGFTCVCV